MFSYFNHNQMRRYILAFGSLFDSIYLTRASEGVEQQRIMVPIEWGSKERYIVRLQQDPEFKQGVGTVVPRMAFELTDISYDSTRKLNTLNRLAFPSVSGEKLTHNYVGTPYNLSFRLSILVKYDSDGYQIVEQILPYFNPDFSFTIHPVEEIGVLDTIPITLNNVSHSDNYEGDFEKRVIVIWELSFTMKVFFYGPVKTQSRIQEVQVDIYDAESTNLILPPEFFGTEDGGALLTHEDRTLIVDEATDVGLINQGLVARVDVEAIPHNQSNLDAPAVITRLSEFEGDKRRDRFFVDKESE